MIGNEFRFQLHIQDLIHKMTKEAEITAEVFRISFRSLFRPFHFNQPRRLRDPRFLHPKRVLIFLTIKCTSRAIIMFSRGWSPKIVETGAEAGGGSGGAGIFVTELELTHFQNKMAKKAIVI